VRLTKRRDQDEPTPHVEGTAVTPGSKGRPTPSRRETVGQRGPVTAPKSRKEAYARQKQLAKVQKTARRTPASQLTVAQRRELMKKGDPSVLPRRDQGPTRKLARDYVDSHRMVSNYMLGLFLLVGLGIVFKPLTLLTPVVIVGLLVEWYLTGRRIRRLAIERDGEAQGSNMGIGLYAGQRAYLPRRWRLPSPQVGLGDSI
jgi:hypothetical protein